MRQIVSLCAAATLAACSSSGSGSSPHMAPKPPEVNTQVNIQGVGNIGIKTVPYQDSYVGVVSYPMGRVWAALPAAYDSVGLKLTTLDPATHTVGNSGVNMRRVLGKTALSKYLDCGRTQVDQNADSYEVHLTMLTTVAADEAGATKVRTTLSAAAKPVAFSGDYVRCTSLGRLEVRLHELMFAELERAGAK
jgi:hypothetical protein